MIHWFFKPCWVCSWWNLDMISWYTRCVLHLFEMYAFFYNQLTHKMCFFYNQLTHMVCPACIMKISYIYNQMTRGMCVLYFIIIFILMDHVTPEIRVITYLPSYLKIFLITLYQKNFKRKKMCILFFLLITLHRVDITLWLVVPDRACHRSAVSIDLLSSLFSAPARCLLVRSVVLW